MVVVLKNTIVHLLHLLLCIGFIIGEGKAKSDPLANTCYLDCVSVVNLK